MKRPPVITQDDRQRFAERVDMSAGLFECWPWRGKPTEAGYGRIRIGGVLMYAHRLAFILAGGALGDDLCACHTCDNPPCCNPAHLFAGTHEDNMRDALAKDRLKRGVLKAPVVEMLRPGGELSGARAADIADVLGISVRTIYRSRRHTYRPAVA